MDPALLGELLGLLMFATVCGVLMLGFPVAFTLAGTAFAFALLGASLGGFDIRLFGGLPSLIFGVMTNEILVAVPLFVFMGVMLQRSRIAEELLETMGNLFGALRGGLGLSVILVGMLMAASTGIVGATVVTMGLLSLPSMLKAGYDPKLACGTICASGTLGQIVPPSIVLVLLGDILQGANTEAQLRLGNFAPDPVSVIDLFAGALLPGMMLVGLYAFWMLGQAVLNPQAVPPVPFEGERRDLARRVMEAMVPPALLILTVLGSILFGAATPTEAAAVGAVGATLLATRSAAGGSARPIRLAFAGLVLLVLLTSFFDLRLRRAVVPTGDMIAAAVAMIICVAVAWGIFVALRRTLKEGVLVPVMDVTMRISSMVFVILLGASMFSLVFRGLGGERLVADVLGNLPGGAFGAMVAVMALMFVMGFFLDFIEIIFIVVPIVGPILLMMGLDPIWLGVMIAVNLQTSFLTPPFGFALFYLRGVAPARVGTGDIYRGIMPFVAIQLIGLGVVAAFPGLVTWLPKTLFGS